MPNRPSASSFTDPSGEDGSHIADHRTANWPRLKAVAFHLLTPVEIIQYGEGKSASAPASWPLLLTRQQLCAYLGGLSWGTLSKVLPVAPLDLGANVLRYSRPQIDAWAANLPPRLPKVVQHESDTPADDGTSERCIRAGNIADEHTFRPTAAVERARQRALGSIGKGR